MACSNPVAASECVTLNAGPTVSVEALALLLHLEERLFDVRVVEHRLQVQPAAELTAGDIQQIRKHRDDLVMLVSYCETTAARLLRGGAGAAMSLQSRRR